jgi:hypothetical protein
MPAWATYRDVRGGFRALTVPSKVAAVAIAPDLQGFGNL